jgi:transposase
MATVTAAMSDLATTSAPKRPAGQTRDLVKKYLGDGLSPRKIALILDLSTSAVYQHIDSLRKAGELPQEQAS